MLDDEAERIKDIHLVLEIMKTRALSLPKNFEKLMTTLKERETYFYTGKIDGKSCQLLWKSMENLTAACSELLPVVKSVVFWNLFNTECSNDQQISEVDMQLSSTPVEKSITADEQAEQDECSLKPSLDYLDKMRTIGLQTYKEQMQTFLNEDDQTFAQILRMFSRSYITVPLSKQEIDVEKQIAEIVLGGTFQSSPWSTLSKIYSIGDLKTKVKSVREFLNIIDVNLDSDKNFQCALDSFENMLTGNIEEITYLQVKTSLEIIYSIVNELPEQAFYIMESIGHCSLLIEFIRLIIDEDLRNLIDAVEDISEQQVQESTVSGLIETKQLLYPIIKQKLSCQQVLDVLKMKLQEIGKLSSLPAKVHDCVENIHNLKSLYNNVANRGEQTKEIVRNILDQGYFKFQLDEKTQTVMLEAAYPLNGSYVTKKEADLNDLRSRSLLLMNTDANNSLPTHLTRTEVETFAKHVDESADLADVFTKLHSSGHHRYIVIDKAVESADLVLEKEKEIKELNNWERELHYQRNKFYLLNFIHGFGLHYMYQYLNNYENLSTEDKEILCNAVQTILNFIHPHFKACTVRQTHIEAKTPCQSLECSNWLSYLGVSLHKSYPKTPSTYDNSAFHSKGTGETLKMTDVVLEGKLFLVQLEENCLYTVRTVITLYTNTVSRMPESHQVLFCTRETTFEEVELLLERCKKAKDFYGQVPLYCIANVELLPSEFYADLIDLLRNISENFNQFLLALVCRGTNSHTIIEEFIQYKSTISPVSKAFVKTIFKTLHGNVNTLTSELAGMGKSSRVIKVAHKEKKIVAVFHITGTSCKAQLIERLNSLKIQPFHVLHIDIGLVDDPKELDTFLFELLVLRYVSVGRMSVALTTEYVFLEIANTINETLRNSLQTALLFSRQHLQWQNFDNFLISGEIQSTVQVVCKYLSFQDKRYLDKKDINLNECKPLSTKRCRLLLKSFFRSDDGLSFPVVKATLDVLADQFKKMACSPFFKVLRLRDMAGNKGDQTVKSSLIAAMMDSTKEFASRSVRCCRTTQVSTIQSDDGQLDDSRDIATQMMQMTKGMIRWENSNHLMFVFHCQNIQTLSPLYRNKDKVPINIKELFCRQMNKNLEDFKTFSQKKLQDLLQKIARNNPIPLPSSELQRIASGYALTPDNLLKMVLIVLRVKAAVPVVIMGETGCGKTSLIRYLASICQVPFDVLNIHAGVTEQTIVERIDYHCTESAKSLHTERWLLLDEINTSKSIGVMSEIICHHRCLGKPIAPNLVIMGACNPYKLRSKQDIATAGLALKSGIDELSRLVYRVLPLPEMMVDYIWDFGSLSEKDEEIYIKRMVAGIFSNEKCNNLFSEMISASQRFVRQVEASLCVVSLRDVNRCSLLTKWFANILCNKNPLKKYSFRCDDHIRAMILSLSHCYHCRFQSKDTRSDYRKVLLSKLKEYEISGFDTNHDVIADIIVEEEKDFIFRMDLPEGTACNSALMENVFVIIVCIYNRLPVFVVGKPGCSKSLAMQLIRSNLRGKDSKDIFFKTLPQLYCVSFQGSESSTSDGIMKVFDKASNYQSSNTTDSVLSVVILDEIGLAEISRFNPLKVLHNLLEPDGKSRPHVAVVGLSNWSLDASKMNRAIHLSRTDMDADELYDTAKAISESFASNVKKYYFSAKDSFLGTLDDNVIKEKYDLVSDIEEELNAIALSYHDYSHKVRFKNFHGLRDFYALVKYVAKTLTAKRISHLLEKSTDSTNVSNIVQSGLERNFGGLPSETSTLYEIFNSYFEIDPNAGKNVLEMITENVNDQIARHLMLITSGDSSLGILEQQLNRIGRNTREVIFGSHFEDDLTDDYNYRMLSRIILCMEEGMILVLKDLENIYGSLYDMLNQNYTYIGKKRNCRVALGAYSNPICQVSNSFRCIVLMDESKLKMCDPPFLNRFEKQYFNFSDILTNEQKQLVDQLQEWIIGLKNIQERSYDYSDIFPVYSTDLLPSLVLKTDQEFGDTGRDDRRHSLLKEECKRKLTWILKPEAVVRLKRAVTTNTINEAEEIKSSYFALPIHRGLQYLISSQQHNLVNSEQNGGILTIVFTNSSMHIKLQQSLDSKNVQIEKLGTFKSEKQFSSRIKHFWSLDSKADILFVQCSAVNDEKHILLTKSIIERHRSIYISEPKPRKHVYFIVHTLKNKGSSNVVSQLNFMSDWNLVMLDNLEPSHTELPILSDMDILQVIEKKRPLHKSLSDLLFWSFTRIKYSPNGRDLQSIKDILTKMKNSQEFLQFLDETIWKLVSDTETQEKDWQVKVACDIQALCSSSNFVDALEQYIMRVIRIPLTKLIFCLENYGILDSFFIEDIISIDRRKIWFNLVKDERLFSIAEIPNETGPECYSCDVPDCSLKMPFSRMIFQRMESRKDEFIEDLAMLRSNYKNEEKGELETFPICLIQDLIETHEVLAVRNFPDLEQFCYNTCENDYIHDFSSLMSVTLCSGMNKDKRVSYMEWNILQKIDLSNKSMLGIIVCLHATSWMNTTLFRSIMQLLAACEKVGFVRHVLEKNVQFDGLKSERLEPIGMRAKQSKTIDEYDAESKSTISNETEFSTAETSSGKSDGEISEDDIFPEDILVEDICKRMIPTKETIESHDGLETWQRTVNAILPLAAKVSLYSDALTELRVCNEIAGTLILPMELEINSFYELGDILLSNTDSFGSKIVFDKILAIVSQGLNSSLKNQDNCYRVLTSYLTRCISANKTDAKVLHHVFQYILTKTVPNTMVHHFKTPLYCALDLETFKMKEDDKLKHFLLYTSAREEEGEILDVNNSSSEKSNCHCFRKSGDYFICAVDNFIRNLMKQNRIDEPFVLLVVDLLANLFKTSLPDCKDSVINDEQLSNVSKCHKEINKKKSGIGFVSAIAYIKSFISVLGRKLMWDHNKTQKYWEKVGELMTDEKSNHIRSALREYFIKSISKGMTILRLKTHVAKMKDNEQILEEIEWRNNFLHFEFDRKPFCTVLDEKTHSLFDLCSGVENKTRIKDTLIELTQKDKKNNEILLHVLSFAFNEHQLTKSISERKDDVDSLLSQFSQDIETDEIKSDWKRILKYLIGSKDFMCKGFSLEVPDNVNYNAHFFLMQLFIFLFSNKEHTTKMSIFIKCLTAPLSIKECFLPGFFDAPVNSKPTEINIQPEIVLATCKCGSRIAMPHSGASIVSNCVFCSESVKCEKPNRDQTDYCRTKPQTVWVFDDMVNNFVTPRGIHPVTFHTLQFIVKGCLLGSLAFEYSTETEIKEVVGETFNLDLLHRDINSHLRILSDLLNIDDITMSSLLRIIILENRTYLCGHHMQLSQSERSEIENGFEKNVKNVLEDRFNTLRVTIKRHNEWHSLPNNSFENCLNERNDITSMSPETRQMQLPLVFRVAETPTKANFYSELLWHRNEFPFLGLILKFEAKLKFTKYLHSIVQWHVSTVGIVSYLLKKHECLEMTVQDLYSLNPKKGKILKTRFDAFVKAWKKLRCLYKITGIGSELKHLHTGSKLKDCLMHDSNTDINRVLQQLVHIQNNFIDETLLVANKSDALHCLSVKENVYVVPCVQITETKKEDLTFTKYKWADILRDNSQSRLEYGCGRETIFNFRRIETMFATKLLIGKSYIDIRHIPNIIFADNVFINYADLLIEIKRLIPQKPLPTKLKDSIKRKLDESQKTSKILLQQLGVLLTLLKKTGGEEDMHVVHYVKKWSNLLSHEFPEDLLTSVLLCHILELNDFVEEILSEAAIDALENDYTEAIDDVAKKHVLHLLKDSKTTRILLQILKRFVFRAVSTKTADANRPISEYLMDSSFWPDNCLKDGNTVTINENIQDIQILLPDYVMVRHVQSFVKEIEKELKKKENEELRLSRTPNFGLEAKNSGRKPKNNAVGKRNTRRNKFREY